MSYYDIGSSCKVHVFRIELRKRRGECIEIKEWFPTQPNIALTDGERKCEKCITSNDG